MGQQQEQAIVTPASPSPATGCKVGRWLLAGFAVLILARALLIHGDVTDFPFDRNLTAGFHITRMLRYTAWGSPAFRWENLRITVQTPETPEFPFVVLGTRVLTDLGLAPIVAARWFSLLMAVLTGAGIYLLGRRLHSRAAGTLALWLFALMPFSIFMGRSLLPEGPMLAAVTWSMLAAGSADPRRSWRSTALLAGALSLASLAKLPAVFFAPAAAALLMERLGWRNRRAWIQLGVCALTVYLVTCGWYKIVPWNPGEGLARISAGTNNMMSSLGDLSGTKAAWVAAMRCVLALTLPGVFLAVLGWVFAQERPDRIWINAWTLLAILFVPVTIRANTYWVYSVVPVGCLLGGLAAAELARLYPAGRWPLAAALLGLLWLCPSVEKVAEYRTLQPDYQELRDVAAKTLSASELDQVYYLGRISSDLQYFVRHRGDSANNPGVGEALDELRKKPYKWIISNRMVDDPVGEALFALKPVLAARAEQFAIFDAIDKPLGEAVAAPAPGAATALDLGGMLKVLNVSAPAAKLAPGSTLELAVTYEKGMKYQAGMALALAFRNLNNGSEIALPPTRGGMQMISWAQPLLQAPDFNDGPVKRMHYAFEIPAHLPAGTYELRMAAVTDKKRGVFNQGKVRLPLALEILPPATLAKTPLALRPEDGYWVNQVSRTAVSWLGTRRTETVLTSFGQLWLRPALPAGEYRMRITARGLPAGLNPKERWPVLNLKPGHGEPVQIELKGGASQTISVPVKWGGPQDFLLFTIANPKMDTTPGNPFALYLDDFERGNRSAVIERVEIR